MESTSEHSSTDELFAEYFEDGTQRARAIPNRGLIRYTSDGAVHPDILAAYWKYGFYVLEGVLGAAELQDLETDVADIMDRLPSSKGATFDKHGRPALGANTKSPNLFWSKPLGDPFGGTALAGGRHPVKMTEHQPADDAPDDVVYLILGSLQFSDALLRAYGHPDLLRVAAAVNGDDFVPFNEALFIKEPGLGASVAWHRDGLTHWDNPDWDAGSHGFNFMGQVYGCTAANAVWVIPGSHRENQVDIKALVRDAGSERLPDAVPLICNPGDVVINNRQLVHGSFANTSKDWRVTANMGFHRRASVLGVQGGGLHNAPAIYDEARIEQRARMIGYAIDARRQRFPDEAGFRYEPFASQGIELTFDDDARKHLLDYNRLDLSI
jgi:hypothetical protein